MSIVRYVEKVWRYFNSIDKELYGIYDPSMPLVYLGNYENYKISPLKIITVGLNPSKDEFSSDNEFSILSNVNINALNENEFYSNNIQTYLNSIDSYFNMNGRDWYLHYESLLNGLNASYFGEYENTVLHTDVLSPLSTNDTWSEYLRNKPSNIIEDYVKNGHSLWLELIDILAPDIIIASLGDKYRRLLFNNQNLNWVKLYSVTKNSEGKTRKRPYNVYSCIGKLPSGKKSLLVFGDRNVVPFMIPNNQKTIVGNKIFKIMRTIYDQKK